jgi:hypothetical protein
VLAIGEPILLKIYGLHGGVFGGLKVNDIKFKTTKHHICPKIISSSVKVCYNTFNLSSVTDHE